MNYAELQVTTHFSFLRGVSSAEELFSAAALLGIKALGVTDRQRCGGSRYRACQSDRSRAPFCSQFVPW
jgi:error-prone DNA polymerase